MAVGPGEVDLGVGEQFDLDRLAVDQMVVSAAEQVQVVEISRSTVFPVVDVVAFGVADGAVAAGVEAAAVAGGES
ncbi:MAG: hypothetical protein Q7V57_12160 [Actinomycetota bacterium]|nr:hypothetical protein [Actinomycetota bacterium]